MKKSLMSNIKHFVDSNVRQRIDRASNNNCEFFGEDILLVEKHFEDIRHVCSKAGKTISALLQSTNLASSSVYSVQNVQASINNLSSLTVVTAATTTTATTTTTASTSTANVNNNSQSLIPQATTSCIANNNSRDATLLFKNSQCQQNSTSKSKPNTSLVGGVNSGQHEVTNRNNASKANSQQRQNPQIIDSQDPAGSDIRKHKKLPIVGFLKFLVKSCHRLKKDSLLHTTLLHCSQLQTQLTKLYLSYEQKVETQCLRPIQQVLEIDAPNVIKLRKLFIKSHNDLESVRAKYNGASQKQQQQQQQLQAGHFTSTSYTVSQNVHQANINKLDQLKKELDDAITRFEQARDTYATELYAFVCRETELVNLFIKFYQYQADYQQQVANAIQSSLPSLSDTLATTPRKVVFSTPLEEHLRCTGRNVSLVIELCVHILYSTALHEEGLFRIPGSSVKIKRLKNAINAWFVTLASQTELENKQQQQLVGSQSPSLLAIYALFKDIVGQKKSSQTTSIADNNANDHVVVATTTSGRDDSTLTHTNTNSQSTTTLSLSSQEPHYLSHLEQKQSIVFDVHTIAGLLKLYLRELSEPLFTYTLYDQFIEATVKSLNTNNQTGTRVNSSEPITTSPVSLLSTSTALGKVVEQLPRANYDNLKLLIRFLHTLTCHREFNRMTATNLAITMAPSLIWSKPVSATPPFCSSDDHSLEGELTQIGEMHALNMQMSSVGISASLHALVIENLINHAETLFPGQMCYTIAVLDEQMPSTSKINRNGNHHKPILSKSDTSKRDRCMKSTSPTGLSTASSSSFSSTASVTSSSANMSNKINQGRKRGSMDGLLKDASTNICPITLDNTNSTPLSVHINQEQQQERSSFQSKQSQQHQPPPVPPAPVARSHSRQAYESPASTTNRPSTTHKQQAPAPPPCALKRQPKITPHSDHSSDYRARALSRQASATGTSLRGTGVVVAQPATRPNVPPPNRPPLSKDKATSSVDSVDSDTQQVENIPSSKVGLKCTSDNENNPNQGDNKSSNSVTSSVNLRADFEEINPTEVDDIDSSAPISPIVSLGSISGGDSSFDEECASLEHSWAECDLEQDGRNQPKVANENSGPYVVTKILSAHDEGSRFELLRDQVIKPAPRLQRKKKNLMNDSKKENGDVGLKQVDENGHNDNDNEEDDDDDDDDDVGEDTLTAAPMKPPRSASPKVTQSTPL